MGRVYSVIAENQTVGGSAAASVLLALQTASTATSAAAIIKLYRVEVTQSGSTTSAMVRLALSTRSNNTNLTVATVTPQNIVAGGPAGGLSGGTSAAAATIGITSSVDTTPTYTNLFVMAPNQLNGYLYLPVPEERIIILPSTVFVVRFVTTVANTAGWDITFIYEEIV